MDNKELIRKSLMGDREAQGIALPCPLCGDDVTITEIPAHKHCIVNLPEYGGGWFIECDNCTYAISGDDVMDALRTHNARPAPPIGRCGECKNWSEGDCYRQELTKADDYCSYFEPREE